MGNQLLIQVFEKPFPQQKSFVLDLLSEEKFVNDLFAQVATIVAGKPENFVLEMLFPETNATSSETVGNGVGDDGISSDEVMKSQTIKKISDSLLSGFAPPESLLNAFHLKSSGEMFTALSPRLVSEYTVLQKKKMMILYAAYVQKQQEGKDKKIDFFDYVKTFLAQSQPDPTKRMLAGFDAGFKFVINMLNEIKSLTSVKGSGFPPSMLTNSLKYLYETLKSLSRGSLHDVDQHSITLDVNLNEARSFLLSVALDASSPADAVSLAAKSIFLLGLARSNVEDLLLSLETLEIRPYVDLRSELEIIKLSSGEAPSRSEAAQVLIKCPEEFGKIVKSASPPFQVMKNVPKINNLSLQDSCVTDGKYFYLFKQRNGISKITIEADGTPGTIVKTISYYHDAILSLAYLQGKIYVRAREKITMNKSREVISFQVIDAETFQYVRPSVGPSLEPPGSDSDDDDIMADMHRYTESHYVDLVHQHHSNNPRSLVHNDIELVKTHKRHVISSPLISDGTYLYVITINKSTTNPIGINDLHDLYNHDNEPSADLILEQFEPSGDGTVDLKFIRETKLLSEDGSKPFMAGSPAVAASNLLKCQVSCNGVILIIHFRQDYIFFDVATGKKLHLTRVGIREEQEIICLDHSTCKFYRFEKNDSKLKYSTFTISVFEKQTPQAAGATSSLQMSGVKGARIIQLQQQLFLKVIESGSKPEGSLYQMNMVERLMFNVQTSDMIKESMSEQKRYQKAIDTSLKESQKTLILAFIDCQIESFEKVLAEAQSKDPKMMVIFKYPNVTLLTSTLFENIKLQLSHAIPIIAGKKTYDNLASQYNFYFILRLLLANFKALNHCRLDLKSLLKDPKTYHSFLQVFQSTVKTVIENGYSSDFQATSEDSADEMRQLWKDIYALCFQILSDSMSLIYSGSSEIMESLEASLSKAEQDKKHADNSTLLLTFLCQQENMRQSLESEESSKRAMRVFEKCSKITLEKTMARVGEISRSEKSEEEEKRGEQVNLEGLGSVCNKYIMLVAKEVLAFYSQATGAKNDEIKKRAKEAQKCLLTIIQRTSENAAKIINEISEFLQIYIERVKTGQSVRDSFENISKKLSTLINQDSAFLKVVQTSIHALSIYPLDTELLAKINPCLLSILEAFHSFNREVNVKRKDTVSMMTQLKEVVSPFNQEDGIDFNVEEFKRLPLKEQAKKVDERSWSKIRPTESTIKIMSHQCKLRHWGRGRQSTSWSCDMYKVLGKCFTGDALHQEGPSEGWCCQKCNFDCCIKCMQVSLYIWKVLQGKIDSKSNSGHAINEIDYSLKTLLDGFSRNICWFLGQSAYKLIRIEQLQASKDAAPSSDEMEQLILQSNLLAGGIDPSQAEKVFQPEAMKVISDLQDLIGVQDKTVKQPQEQEQDKLLQAVIHSGQNEHVDRLISYLQQIYERKVFAIAKLGLADGLRLTRAAFASLLKFGCFLEVFAQLADEVDLTWAANKANAKDIDSRIKEAILAFPGYDDIAISFERASKMRQWINEHKNAVIDRLKREVQKSQPDATESEREEAADKRFSVELQESFTKVVEKAEFLIKLRVPEAFLVKVQTKGKPDTQSVNLAVTQSFQIDDLQDRLSDWKIMMNSKGFEQDPKMKNKDIFESSVMSVLTYLQAPISLKKIESQVEEIYIKGKNRATGLKILAQLLNFEHLPKTHRYDLMCWFSSGLRQKKNELTNYLDGLKGCGSLIEEQIKFYFFGILQGLISQLKSSEDEADVKMIINTLRWKFSGKDHGPLKHLNIFRALYEGAGGGQESILSSSWGRTIQVKVHSSEYSKPVAEQVVDLFESLYLTVLSRMIQKDHAQKIKLTGSLTMTKSHSVIDETDTESLILQSFNIIFREFNRYIDYASSFQGIDWNTYLAKMEAPQKKKAWFDKLIESELKGPDYPQLVYFNDKEKLAAFKEHRTIPFMKEFKVMILADYVLGIEIIYHGPNPGEEFSAGKNKGTSDISLRWQTFTFEEGEFITSLSIRSSEYISRIQFVTNKSREFNAGGDDGQLKDIIKSDTSSNTLSRVVALAGAHGESYLCNLKAYYLTVLNTQAQAAASIPRVIEPPRMPNQPNGLDYSFQLDGSGLDDDSQDLYYDEEDDNVGRARQERQRARNNSQEEEKKAPPRRNPPIVQARKVVVKQQVEEDEDRKIPREAEERIVNERNMKIEEEMSKLKSVYSEQFLRRLLRLMEIYTALASTQELNYLQPLQNVNFLKTMLNLLILANPKVKMVVLRIIQNLLKAQKIGPELYENSIKALLADDKCVKAHKFAKNSPTKVEGSQFMQFFFSYLIDLRSKIWHKTTVESEGTYAVTEEIVRILQFLTEGCQHEHFRKVGRAKLKQFLTSPFNTWDIKEADVFLSLLDSGSFANLMMGSQAFYDDSQLCVILGFTEHFVALGDLKNLDITLINDFRTTINCSDPLTQKALVMFLGERDSKDLIPLVNVVDVSSLRPITHSLVKSHEKRILYDKEVLGKVMELIKVDIDSNTSMVIRQSQVQAINAITQMVETEINESGGESQFLKLLAEEKYLGDFLQSIQRNASKSLSVRWKEYNLTPEFLELGLTEIREKCLESQISLLKRPQFQDAAIFSDLDDSILIFDRAAKGKKSSFFHTASITSSINEDSLSSGQKSARHSITLFSSVTSYPSLLLEHPFDLLFASSADLLQHPTLLLAHALLNSKITVFDDAVEPHILFEALKTLDQQLPPVERYEPCLHHRPVFLIAQKDMAKVQARDTTGTRSIWHERRSVQYNQFQGDLRSWAGFTGEQMEAIKNRDEAKEGSIKEVLKLQAQSEAGEVSKPMIKVRSETSKVLLMQIRQMSSPPKKQDEEVEDLGIKMVEESFSPLQLKLRTLIDYDFKDVKGPERNTTHQEKSRERALSSVISGIQKLTTQEQLLQRYVDTLDRLLCLRSRSLIITLFNHLNPLPAEIQKNVTSQEKLLLITFNEGVNMKQLTGSKDLQQNVVTYILRLLEIHATSSFALKFIKNSVLKQSLAVINLITTSKKFLANGAFENEEEESNYPHPSMPYAVTKQLLASPIGLSIFRAARGFLLNTFTILLGHVLAQTKRYPNLLTFQNKYLALAAKLLTHVRTTQEQWPESIVREVVECRILQEIDKRIVDKVRGSKAHEPSRLYREILYEWYCIRRAYIKTHPKYEIREKFNNVKFLKKMDYVCNRDPLALVQLQLSAKSLPSVSFVTIREILEQKIKKDYKTLPCGSVSDCLVKIRPPQGSEGCICIIDITKIMEEIDFDYVTFYYDKMCQKQINADDLVTGVVLAKEVYMRYAPSCLENRLIYCGWSKNLRLPNGVSDPSHFQDIQTRCLCPIITQMSTCKNATMLLYETGTLLVTGLIKSLKTPQKKIFNVFYFSTTVKLISAGRMTLAVVLSSDEVQLYGYNKDGEHFKGTDNGNKEGWNIVKIQPTLDQDDSIVDLASGTHFTLFATKNGYLYGTGKRFLQIIGMENTGNFQKFRLNPALKVRRVWCSRGKETYLAIIEVYNKSNGQTYLMAAGNSTDGLLGQGSNQVTRLTTFTKLNYDHEKIQFKKISMLTRHALAITTSGELYGWGSNECHRLGNPAEVKSLNKPTPIDFFNKKQEYAILDIACGDDHSFVYTYSTINNKQGFTQDTIFQIGYNKEEKNDEACTHRAMAKEDLDQEAPAQNGIVWLKNDLGLIQIKLMAAGHKTSFFWTGEERIYSGKNGVEISFLNVPATSWADFDIRNSFDGKNSKRGYVHIIRDPIAQNREVLLQKRTYEFLPIIQENLARVSIQQDGTWSAKPAIDGQQDSLERIQGIIQWQEKLQEGAYDPFKRGWFLYSQSELQRFGRTFPRVTLALRHNIHDLHKKLQYFEEPLEQAQALYSLKGPLANDFICSETGKKIYGSFYYGSYFNENQELEQIFLSEEAFAEPTTFDLIYIPYYRFASPLPKAAKLPGPFDLKYLHQGIYRQKFFSFSVNSTAFHYTNKQELCDIMEKVEDETQWKKVLEMLLKKGNQFQSQIAQFVQDNKYLLSIQRLFTMMTEEKKELREFFFNKQPYNGTSEAKKVLTQLQKIIKEDTYTGYQIGFGELALFFDLATDMVQRLSLRPLKNCHPQSLPYIKRQLLQELPLNIRNSLIDRQIYELPGGSQFEVTVRRRKAVLFGETGQCDNQGIHTVFGQIWQEMKKTPESFQAFQASNVDTQILRVNFIGEGSIDAGGPYRETLTNICKELMSHVLPLLIQTPNNKNNHGQYRECWMANPSASSPIHLEMFKFFGFFIGTAIRSQQSLPLDLAPIFWKMLNDQTGECQTQKENELDLKAFDTYSWQVLHDLRKNTKKISAEEFSLAIDEYFVTLLSNGKQVELVPGGRQKRVTKANLKEYIQLVVSKRLNESRKQIKAIQEGVNFVIPLDICSMLTWQMIENRATGNKTLDVSKLKAITDYNGCSENDDFIGYFWEVLLSFSPEERSLYLKFVWGRARLPGTTEHRHKIVAMQYHANACLPVSHTCFFTLDLPRYPSVEIARERIWYAIKFCGDIDADLAANEINHDE